MHFRIVQHFGKPRARYSKTFDVTRPPPSTLDFGCEIAKQLVRWDRILQPYFVTTISLLSVCVPNCEITAKKWAKMFPSLGVDNLPESEATYPGLTIVEIYPGSICKLSAQVLINTQKGKKVFTKKKYSPPATDYPRFNRKGIVQIILKHTFTRFWPTDKIF